MSSARSGNSGWQDLFDALAQRLRERIATDGLVPGTLLPSETELARDYGVKRYSIRKAMLQLRAEGIVEPVAGRGWAVVDRDAGSSGLVPRYRQIVNELRDAMTRGSLAPGSALPSESELMVEHSVSRATVRRALEVLESDGLISTHPGKGRYVRRS